MASATKIIVVNRRATTAKYGTAGWKKIRTALTALTAADRARSLTTKVFAVDSPADAAKLGVAAIVPGTAVDAAAVKRFVDGVTSTLVPDYIMLLGSTDLLPQAE